MNCFSLLTRAQLINPNFRPTLADEVMAEAIMTEMHPGPVEETLVFTGNAGLYFTFAFPVSAGLYRVDMAYLVSTTTAATGLGTARTFYVDELGATSKNQADTIDLTITDRGYGSVIFPVASGSVSAGIESTGFTTGSATVKFKATISRLA